MVKRIYRQRKLPAPPDFSPKRFMEQHDKVLIVRPMGGAGDIIMHRLMFEDFRAVHPDLKIHFACPATFHDLVRGHPFVDKILDSAVVETRDYVISYNTGGACLRYETHNYPMPLKHRSDIWAEHCGVTLTHHNAHMTASDSQKRLGLELLRQYVQDRPVLLVCPVAQMSPRNLLPQQVQWIVQAARRAGFGVLGCHPTTIPVLDDLGVPVLTGMTDDQWIGVMATADYVVSTDTAHFHLAGVLGTPLLGLFAMTDGKVYGKYYENWELVQKHRDDGWDCGPCYDWTRCPKASDAPFPCMSSISKEMIEDGLERLLERFPPRGG